MTLRLPLTVRLDTGGIPPTTSLHITHQIRDLTFRSVVPGGFASCTVSLDRPLYLQPLEVGPFGRLYVFYGLDTVWEGRLEDPGRTASADGQVWDLTAVGPSAHAQDRTVPLIYIDGQYDKWIRTDGTPPGGTFEVGEAGDGRATLMVRFPQGLDIPASGRTSCAYPLIEQSGQHIARIDFTYRSGFAGSFQIQCLVRTGGALSSSTTVMDNASATSESSATALVWGTAWTSGNANNWVELRQFRTSAVTWTGDTAWTIFLGAKVQGSRYNLDGTEKTSGYTTSYVTAEDVVTDLLGRLLTAYDGPNATLLDPLDYTIDQLAYPDGVTPAKVLDDLMALEPAQYWAAWESNPDTGLYRFEWTTWPTAVRYEADVADGFDAPGSAADLYNAVTVRYKTARGLIATLRRTQTVPDLTAVGLTRDGFVDLGDEVASAANAQQAGDQFLADHAYPLNAGRLTVARPIMDLQLGRMVAPWEIRPGRLIRVRGVLPRVDALNTSGRDGVTVYRVVSVTFNASSASADLELDSYSWSLARALAEVSTAHHFPLSPRVRFFRRR